MTSVEFDSLNLQTKDIIDVSFKDGSTKRYLLFDGKATIEVPEKNKYLTGEIVPSIPSKIIVQGAYGAEEGLTLAYIKAVEKVATI